MVSRTASEARATLPELLTRVSRGEDVTITRHGHVVAMLVRPDSLRARRGHRALADAEAIHEIVANATVAPLPEAAALTTERAEELIAQIRAERDPR